MRTRLDAITLKGFKTIRELNDFRPGSLTVLIGPNGAGKSNFLSFFHMLYPVTYGTVTLQYYVSAHGGASKLLHDGPAITPEIDAQLRLQFEAGKTDYHFRLAYAADDTLIYADERCRLVNGDQTGKSSWQIGGAGHRSSMLGDYQTANDTTAVIADALRNMFTFHFHDTSVTSQLRRKAEVTSDGQFHYSGSNLAPFLHRLWRREGRSYQRIVETLRLILPFFFDFYLESDSGHFLLAWRETGSDQIFTVSQAADGMLRTIALVTLLLQPEDTLPDLLIIDEPELGLHPYAINIIGGLIRAVSEKTQVIVATQSPALVDCFEPRDIVVVERDGRESTFQRLEDTAALQEWLKAYSLSELWEKNVIGGRP
ncbi:MAG: AAA family ATPase [Caldilineaceae bacterium]|nr:AAA family ATPase [Caldilineaceae bacterium]